MFKEKSLLNKTFKITMHNSQYNNNKSFDLIDKKSTDNFKKEIARLIRVFNVQLNLSGWS